MAAIVLSGQKPMSDVAVQKASQGLLAINTQAAAAQGVTFPPDVMKDVKQTYNEIAVPKP